ncbi:MFS transporter [Listeria costaricensis]|uniref:MFS transporter n=1 Tax=Listeria costaricensis TaxID=2026604 RepID=UPI000C06C651|nr:MFS transporter [Listeria costaricensis]
MKSKYFSTSLGLYINYFVHGMALIIIAQNMDAFADQWHTDMAGVAFVVSSFGIGKLIAVFFSGKLSDHFGRKLSIIVGALFYLAFFIGILVSPNTEIAYIFGISAGFANSFLDTGTYPALMEAYPKKAASANIVVKAFVQAGQFLLPFMIAFIMSQHLWFGWSIIFLIAVLSLNTIFIATRKFPPMVEADTPAKTQEQPVSKWHFSVDEICLICFGFVAQALLYLLSNWIAKYGSIVVGMSENTSKMLVSLESIGAIICVIVTFTLGSRGVSTLKILLTYLTMTMFISLVLWAVPNPIVATICSVLLGYFSAGGLIQLGLTLLAEVSTRGKGFVTSLYTIAEGIAVFGIPIVAGAMSRTNIANIYLLNALVALFGLTLLIIILVRKKQRAEEPKTSSLS